MSLCLRACRSLVCLVLLASCGPALATIVYGSTFASPGQLWRIDTVTHQVTPLLTTGAFTDSLIFDPAGRIVYSVFGANQVRRFDRNTLQDVLISGAFSGPLDIALEPGGTTALVANNTTPRIDRLNLATGAVTPFLNTGGGGLVYDTGGRLFAVLPGQLAQLNPTTGATIQNTPGTLVLDGLAFDPSTGNLFATDGSGGNVLRFDPNDLAAGGQLVANLIASGGFADGIAADGTGQLFVAVRNIGNESVSGLVQVDATTGAHQQVATLAFLDDIAPLSGIGAPPVTVAPPPAIASNIPTLSLPALASLTLLVMLVAMGLRRRA